ncbi:hypothetical protein UFOVP574_40 [uncultured Caudovirales phage]|uniref:Uncharacterized protein n=1 Tax=uncultured Caudovirales phage TaxID=2100421 RepID=A0A6J5MY18_9CAUD|nr:hypothetical protein UFOVP574_40 [uncultured Caudovirales phage]
MAFNPQTGEYEQDMVADPVNPPASNPFGFDPGQATRDYLAGVANPQTLTALLGAEGAARPALGALGLKDIGQYTGGAAAFDPQAFLNARPDILANYRGDPGYAQMYGSLEQYAKAAADAEGLTPQFTTKQGGSLDLLKEAAGVTSGVETAANTALRTAGAADVAGLAPQLAATYNQINPEVLGSLQRAQTLQASTDQYGGMRNAIQNAQQFGNLQFNPAQASLLGAAPQVGLGGYNAAQVGAQGYNPTQASAQGYNAALAQSQGYQAQQAQSQGYQSQGYTPQGYQAAQAGTGMQTEAERLARGQLGQSLYAEALQAGPSQAARTLGDRAAQFATSTGGLSPEEIRNLQQGTREAYAARGIEMSNPAIAAEAAARSGAMRQRQAEDLATATALNQAYTQDLTTNRNFGTGLYGQEIGLQQSNQQAALQAALANQQANQNVALANVGATNQANQFTAGLGAEAAQFTANAANQAGQFGASAFNQAQLQNALLGSQAGQFTASAANQAALQNAQNITGANQFGAGAQNQVSLANQAAANQASQFGAGAQNQANLANQAALNQARQFGAEAGNQGQLTNAQLQAQYAMANQGAANQFALTNQAAGLDVNAQNRLFAANQQQQNISNLGLLGQAGTNAAEANRAYALNLAQGYRGAAYDPSAMLLGQQSNAPQTAAAQQGYALDLAKTFNTPTTYNPDTGINLSLANQANITNQNIAQQSAAAQLQAAKESASATKTAGITSGIGSLLGGAAGAALIVA